MRTFFPLRLSSLRLGYSVAFILTIGACAQKGGAIDEKPTDRKVADREATSDRDKHQSREESLKEAAEFGIIGVPSGGLGAPVGREGEGGGGRADGLGLSGFGSGAGSLGRGSPPSHDAKRYAERSPGYSVPVTETPAEPPRRVFNPNARYATTYRPGGAALAAFDSALEKGSIPVGYKDLVGDFAARYAPTIEPAQNSALAVSFDTERTALPPEGGPVHLRVAIQGADVAPTRPHLSVNLVLDRSGSMTSGSAIERAKEAADALVDRLDPQDDFSLVTFSTDAELLVPLGNVGSRKALIHQKIGSIKAEGGTNISAGLDWGYAQAKRKSGNQSNVSIVMLLSDGHANAGDTSQEGLSKRTEDAFQSGIQTSTFGLGDSFDPRLMNAIAERGAGGYYYLADASQIAKALTTELDARLMPVAQALEVRLRLRPDVTVSKVYGSRELSSVEASHVRFQEVSTDRNVKNHDGIKADRATDAEGGMRFFIPSFSRGDKHAMLFELNVPKGVGDRAIASVELRYKDRIVRQNVAKEVAIKVSFADSDASSFATLSPSVQKSVQAFAAGEAISQSAERLAQGDRVSAERLLRERSELLTAASDRFDDKAFRDDAMRLSRLAVAVKEARVEPVAMALLLRSSARGYMQ